MVSIQTDFVFKCTDTVEWMEWVEKWRQPVNQQALTTVTYASKDSIMLARHLRVHSDKTVLSGG